MFDNCVDVPPSGDSTGFTDWEQITAATRALERPKGGRLAGQVQLSGHYRVNKPLVTGSYVDGVTTIPATPWGIGHALIEYVGPLTDDYVLRCYGSENVTCQGMGNLTLMCRNKTRGVLLTGWTYLGSVQNLHIHNSRQSGLDMVDCWAAYVRGVHIEKGKGYAARFYRCNASRIDWLRVNTKTGVWPPDDDAACVGLGNAPYRTTERCGLHIDQCTGLIVSTLVCEGADYLADPIVFLRGEACLFERPYFESNKITGSLMQIAGVGRWGRCNAIRGASVHRSQCASLVNFTGSTSGNVIEQCSETGQFSVGLTVQDNGQHTGNTIL